MEFIGQIKKILPTKEGVSQRTGNQWKTQPFVFEYYENQTDRYADSVVLETFDTNVMSQLKEFAKVRIGFGHHTREHEGARRRWRCGTATAYGKPGTGSCTTAYCKPAARTTTGRR